MLEPYDEVAVLVPDDHVGARDERPLRPARPAARHRQGAARTAPRCAPTCRRAELVRYAIDLRASTHGAGTFTRSFAHYEPMAENHAQEVSPRG